MSRLIDELNKTAKVTPQPMGFKSALPTSSKPRIILIAGLAEIGDADQSGGLVDGSDAVLIRLSKSDLTAKTLQKNTDSMPDLPWGGWLDNIGIKKMETLVGAGCDFLVFPSTSQFVAPLKDDKPGKILQVELSLDEGLVRAINDLPVEAVFAANTWKADDSLAWHHLMRFQYFSNLLNKPLLVSVPMNVTSDELKALWEAGVEGVVVEAGASQLTGRLKELRMAIDKITFPLSRKRGKTEAILPRMGVESAMITEDEEDEEEYQ
ncbi:hypothetical protein ACFLWU_00485 [Chloroflexota bacterium]